MRDRSSNYEFELNYIILTIVLIGDFLDWNI